MLIYVKGGVMLTGEDAKTKDGLNGSDYHRSHTGLGGLWLISKDRFFD
jgi:hypothetical protein